MYTSKLQIGSYFSLFFSFLELWPLHWWLTTLELQGCSSSYISYSYMHACHMCIACDVHWDKRFLKVILLLMYLHAHECEPDMSIACMGTNINFELSDPVDAAVRHPSPQAGPSTPPLPLRQALSSSLQPAPQLQASTLCGGKQKAVLQKPRSFPAGRASPLLYQWPLVYESSFMHVVHKLESSSMCGGSTRCALIRTHFVSTLDVIW